jgi:hypothetical protein
VTRIPHWLIAMFAGLLGAALLGRTGAPALAAVLFGALVGMGALRLLRDPPWTLAGRRGWRALATRLLRSVASLRQRWRARGGGGVVVPPTPVRGWPGGPGSAWTGAASDARPPRPPDQATMPGAEVTVRCEVVTGRLQVWHSTDTGRAYEVPAERGLAGAAPGDVGLLRFERGKPRVVARRLN